MSLVEARKPVELVQRILDPRTEDTLQRLAAANLAEQGKLCLIGLRAIAERLGGRWPVRKDAVYDHVERGLERHLGPDSVFLRVTETDYLIAQPSLEKAAAQGFCLRFMRETLRHFLGDSNDAEVAVLEVKRLDDRSIEAGAIDTIAAAAYAEMAYAAVTGTLMPPPAPLPAANPWSPFVSSDGRELHVSCYLQRMLNLKTYDSIGYRVGRFVVTDAQGRLSPQQMAVMSRADIERIDKASIYQSLNLLRDKDVKPVIMVLPLSFTTLNSSRGRSMLAQAFKEATSLVTGGLVAGIYDVEGVPPSTLLSASSLLRPFCLRMFASLHAPSRTDLRRLNGSGLNGVGVYCPPFEGDAQFIGWTKALVAESMRSVGAVMLNGLKNERRAAIAATLGVTHAALWEEEWSSKDTVVAEKTRPADRGLLAMG